MTKVLTVSEAARRYAAAGWPVHPLHDTAAGHCSCAAGPDCRQPGKHPRTAHGFHDASRDTEIVARWWRRWPHANIGVPTGTTSRMAVIDRDGTAGNATWHALTAEHGDTATAVAITPHGRHHWFRLPDGLTVPRSIRGLGDGIDLLGDDGYAIAAPSRITRCPRHHNADDQCGDGYRWTPSTRHLMLLPAWIPGLLEDRAHTVTRPARDADRTRRTCAIREQYEAAQSARDASTSGTRVKHPRRYALAALRGEADRVTNAASGQRNDALNYAAWRLTEHVAAGALTEHEVRDTLARAAENCGLASDDGERGVHTTITSALRSSGRTL